VRSRNHEREASGSADGLVVAMKEGNASEAKEPWAGRSGAEGRTGTQCREHRASTNQTRHGVNRIADRVCTPSLERPVYREDSTRISLRFQPDWGNLAVRDDSGGYRTDWCVYDIPERHPPIFHISSSKLSRIPHFDVRTSRIRRELLGIPFGTLDAYYLGSPQPGLQLSTELRILHDPPVRSAAERSCRCALQPASNRSKSNRRFCL